MVDDNGDGVGQVRDAIVGDIGGVPAATAFETLTSWNPLSGW
jgi:hypothetical protein